MSTGRSVNPTTACEDPSYLPRISFTSRTSADASSSAIFSLGEQFRCHFDVNPVRLDPHSAQLSITESVLDEAPFSLAPNVCESQTSHPDNFNTSASSTHHEVRSISTVATSVSAGTSCNKTARVVFLNEQVSHHPPISCFWYESRPLAGADDHDHSNKPPAHVIAYGVDQISAKFTGTSVKVFSGPMNKGIFVKLPERDEEYEVGAQSNSFCNIGHVQFIGALFHIRFGFLHLCCLGFTPHCNHCWPAESKSLRGHLRSHIYHLSRL